MAISKSFFGIRSGSTKSHTYQRYRNQQVTKDRVTSVTNPQTSAQMKQRMQLAYIGQLASALKGIVDHSFEGVETGYKSIAEFKRINLSAENSPSYVLLSPKGYMNIGVGGAIVSNGSLNDSFTLNSIETNDALLCSGAALPEISTLSSVNQTSKRALTSDEISTILNHFGWGDNMQVSILLQYIPTMTATEYQDGYYTYPTAFCIGRYIFDANDPAKLTAVGYYDTVSDDKKVPVLKIMDKKGLYTIEWKNGHFYCDIVAPDLRDEKYIVAAAIIFSQKVDGVYKRNRAHFVVNRHLNSDLPDTDLLNSSTKLGSNWRAAMETYIKSSNKSSKYLNQGDDSIGSIGEA